MVEYGRAGYRGPSAPAARVAWGATVVSASALFTSCAGTSPKPSGDSFSGVDAGIVHRDARSDDSSTSSDSAVDSFVADVFACEAGLTFCGGGCTDTKKDPSNCGLCTNACGGVFQCVNSQCMCPVGGGQAVCSNTCVNTAMDPSNCGACGHSCQGSTCASSLCQPTIVAMVSGATIGIGDIAVDPQNVYWSQVATGMDHGRVTSKPFAGNSPGAYIDSTIDPILLDPHGMAVDKYNMYWVDTLSGAVEAFSPISGRYTVLRGSLLEGGTSDSPLDIVSDGQNVYWVTYDGGEVISEPIGGGPEMIVAQNENHPHAIAFDTANVYWVDYGNANPAIASGSVKQAPKGAPSTPATLVVLAQNEDQPWDIAVDDTNVYWTNRANPGQVKTVQIGGGAVVTLASGQGAPYGIAVDADYVYWTNFDNNTVMRLPKLGDTGAPFVLASGQNNPSAIAVDAVTTGARLGSAQNVYWATGAGTILKVAR